jgi:ectoine hydroxylase-related dioxygenase (phytanoyl-CoA dioxygenase family)
MNRELMRDITPEEMETYDHDGVVYLPGILDKEWVERMRVAVDRVLDVPGPRGMDLNPEGSEGRFYYDTYMWTRDHDFRAFLFESPMAEMAAKVMQSSKAHLLWEFISIKEPNSPYPTDWHQDIAGNPVKGPQCCGTWLSLDEVTIQSGAVEYIKGSHRWGRYFQVGSKLEYYLHEEVQDDDSIREMLFEEFPDFDELRPYYEKDIVHFDVQPGDVVMHQLLTIHGAPGNLSNRRRRAIAPRWVGDKAVFAGRTNKFYTDSLQPPWDPGLKDGDAFPPDHHLFPQVWPEPLGAAAQKAAE